jgi:biopolymer transport protein ExbD/biopolymer transport protein TolR
MGIVKRDEGKKVNSNINVTPMVDVMLVLLIIFMVITPMLQNKVNVTMAQVENPTAMPDADKEDSLVIAITRDSRVYINQDQVAMDDLASKVRDRIGDKTDKPVFLRADARAKYGTVTEAIDNIRTTGISEVGLLTEQRQGAEVPAKGGQ